MHQTGEVVTRSLEFDRLPLVEVALRTSFQAPVPVSFATLNGVRGELALEFRSLDELSQIEAAPGVNATVAFGAGQVLGAVLSGHNLGLRVSIQHHVVVTRWIREHHVGAPQYARFDELRQCHWKVVRTLLRVAKQSNPQFGAVNMSYANFLQVDPSTNALEQYFAPAAQVGLTTNARRLHKVEIAWQDDGGVDLRFRLERVGIQWGNERKDGYNLTTVAGSAVASDTDAEDRLCLVHDRLQGFFKTLISDRAKIEWGYHESGDN